MFVSRRITMIVSLLVAILALNVSVSFADSVQGRLRSIARDAALLSLDVDSETVLFINWTKGTSWKNLKTPADLRVDDVLVVDYDKKGDQLLATTVSLLQPIVPAGMKVIPLETLAGYLDKRGVAAPFTLIDTRPVDLYDAAHLPGAVSIPLRRIEKQPAGILPEDRTAALVFYDNGAGDGSAAKAAEIAIKAGFTGVALFPEGAAGWVKSGRFLESSPAFLRKRKGIILDLRSPEKVAAGHIARAVSIPAPELAGSQAQFPKEKWAPIVVYGESDAEALAAARTIREWGYRYVTIYFGGVAAWQESAETLTTEKVDTFIQPHAASRGGGLEAKDFELALISPVSVQIVDVRSDADYAKGHLPNAVHIPLQQLPARHGELDRELIQVVFAKDASQAEMAADFLIQKTYRVNYLRGAVEFQGEGKYEVK